MENFQIFDGPTCLLGTEKCEKLKFKNFDKEILKYFGYFRKTLEISNLKSRKTLKNWKKTWKTPKKSKNLKSPAKIPACLKILKIYKSNKN